MRPKLKRLGPGVYEHIDVNGDRWLIESHKPYEDYGYGRAIQWRVHDPTGRSDDVYAAKWEAVEALEDLLSWKGRKK